MSVSKCPAVAAGLLWIIAMLLPVAASGHEQAEASEETKVSAAGGFPGWMRLVIVERALERVARRGDAGGQAGDGRARAGGTSAGSPKANMAESAVERAGLGPAVSRTSATVTLSTVDRVDRTALEAARERLLSVDPRRDAYIETAPAIFDAWSGELDPVRDAPDAEVVFLPEAPQGEVEAAMTDAGFAPDEWVLLDANSESSDGLLYGFPYPTPRLIAGLALIGMVLIAAGILLPARKGISVRLFALFLLVGVGLLAWRLGQSDDRGGASNPADRQWSVVSVTADPEAAERADNLFEAGQADFETARNPGIPHFGILLSHLAYQEAFAWGREFLPPRKGEVVHTPGLPSGNAHDRDLRIIYDDRWLEWRTSAEHDPLAALLRSAAGMAPLEYRRIEAPVGRGNMSPARPRGDLARRTSSSSPWRVAALPRRAAALPRAALTGIAVFVVIFFIRLQRVRRSDRVVQRLESNCVLITSAFFLIKCLRAKTCLRRHR